MSFFFLIGILLLSSLVCLLPQMTGRSLRLVGLSSSIVTLVALVWYVGPVFVGIIPQWQTSWWEINRFSSLMGLLVTWLYACAMLVSYHYLAVEERKGILTLKHLRLYMLSVPLFVLSMVVAIFANNVGLLWVALEATTLSTTLLVSFYGKKSSMEAAWKYIVLCSTGIALGLFGILVLGYAGSGAGLHEAEAFRINLLSEVAPSMNPGVVMWAFVFLFIGFGTKIGFVPMHTWLPDAHSKTPAPVSAMLSGILLNVAFFTLLRFKGVVDQTLGSGDWTNHFFLIFGVLTVLLPSIILLSQRNYKRMLAYSSVEHMGIMAFLVGLGPIGLVAFTTHMIGHTLAKSTLFFGAGELLQRFESTKFRLVHDVMRRAPRTGFLFLGSLLLLIAVPPSGLFLSEYVLVGEGMMQHPVLTGIIVLGLAMAGLGMVRAVFGLLFSPAIADEKLNVPVETWNLTHTVMVIQLVLGTAFGLWMLSGQGWKTLSEISASVFIL
ncbi:MAG: proton-conducting transporter membrane subunit [Patescibacteria group bacterium]